MRQFNSDWNYSVLATMQALTFKNCISNDLSNAHTSGLAACYYFIVSFSYIIIGLGWPLNYHFTFYICILVLFLIVGLTFGLPKTSEKKRDTIERAS